ncbi:hypothetical protein OHC33_010042 [Knufia fluminis]|uniref:Major facilitator superfamily (MFS) profile domain-containing protein n=1 Tax=Knufia fluminis TaxID=191047 RepID=A0AAN8EZB5_9EURO|nr:hypothetical protein OHC33_010042 [Knufia fluminis]
MEAKNDLGLTESMPERDLEAYTAAKEAGEPLEAIKTSASRGPNQLTSTLSRTLSKVRTSDTLDPGPPPDGGFQAWATAVWTDFIFNTWGFINSFGLFQSYYVDNMQIGSPSAVAWIGTIQVWILFNVGTFSGRATDAGFFKLTFTLGAVISLFGMFMLSLCKTYWQVFLAQGVCIGLGFGLVFVPSIAIVSTYFLKNRSIALGITVTGSATGGLVFPAIAREMLPTSGFGWTVRTMAFVQMACFVVCILFLKPRLPPRKAGPIVEWAAFKETAYSLYLLCGFFFFWSVYIGFFYITSFSRNVLGASQSTSISLLLAMNGVGVVGRLAVNITANYLGPINILWPFIVASGVMGFGWIGVHNIAGLWPFTCIYGITGAALQGLWPVVLTSLTEDPKKVGVRTGMGFAFVGFV